jgi:hypothetical protein
MRLFKGKSARIVVTMGEGSDLPRRPLELPQ